nr:GTP cyclohydrolase FolE2 [Treponema parvum]
MSKNHMPDIQNESDFRRIPLQKVGVKGVKYPIQVLDKSKKTQHTTADVELYVNLPHHFKGTHMSRFIEIFHKYHKNLSLNRFLSMLEEIRKKLEAERAYGVVTFPYFIEKHAPVTKESAIMCYTCSYEGAVGKDFHNFFISVDVPVTTLCPCSKAISDKGAHNQRGRVRVKLLYEDFFWIEDLIFAVEQCASSALYSLLKRPDEKFVTERAYDNPRFVEDIVREVYLALKKFPVERPFAWFCVEAENEESIHAHNAYACAEYGSYEPFQI